MVHGDGGAGFLGELAAAVVGDGEVLADGEAIGGPEIVVGYPVGGGVAELECSLEGRVAAESSFPL